jgi:hypothetical protein
MLRADGVVSVRTDFAKGILGFCWLQAKISTQALKIADTHNENAEWPRKPVRLGKGNDGNKLQLGRDSAVSAHTSYFFQLPCLNPRQLKSSRAHRVQGRAD